MSGEPGNNEPVARCVPTGGERRRLLRSIRRNLIAAPNGPGSELYMEEVRKKYLLAAPRKQAGKKSTKPRFDC